MIFEYTARAGVLLARSSSNNRGTSYYLRRVHCSAKRLPALSFDKRHKSRRFRVDFSVGQRVPTRNIHCSLLPVAAPWEIYKKIEKINAIAFIFTIQVRVHCSLHFVPFPALSSSNNKIANAFASAILLATGCLPRFELELRVPQTLVLTITP